MTIRKAAKKVLHMISPAWEAKCADLWDALQPIMRRRMTLRNGTKYIMRGLCPGIGGKFTYCGTKTYFPKGSALFRAVCERGPWEPTTIEWLQHSVRPNEWFFDVGSNIGLTSIPVLRGNVKVRVLSFEPSPNSAPYLNRTRCECDFMDRWEIVPKAAADVVGLAQFYISVPSKGPWDGLQNTQLAGGRRLIEVPQTTIDAEWHRLGCPPVSCIKIDVEGAESKVLKGAEQLIARQSPPIILEWSAVHLIANGTEPGFLSDYAQSHNYELRAFPSMTRIPGSSELEMEMHNIEMFVLLPNGSIRRV